MQPGLRGYLYLIPRLKIPAVQVCGYLKGCRREITDQHPHGLPGSF